MISTDAIDAATVIETIINDRGRSCPDLTDEELDEIISRYLPEPSATEPRPLPAVPTIVDSLSVRGIRSFGPEQTLRLSESLTIVYAGNGKGKTSLTDALELITGGATTRKVSLPNAAAEVKDKDHITHRMPNGEMDPEHPPRVQIRYRDGAELRSCEWTTFGSPAARHPDLQILPRRLLRELVNAKRTERTEPLGAALGLTDTIECWTAIAKELRARASAAREEIEPYLDLLSEEVPKIYADTEPLAALQRWEQLQSTHPVLLEEPPEPALWHELSRDLATDEQSGTYPVVLDADLEKLLRSFVVVAEPDEACPACKQASVPTSRITEVETLLERAGQSKIRAARADALASRCDSLATGLSSWLEMTKSSERLPSSWTTTLATLRRMVTTRDQFGSLQWSREIVTALESLRSDRAQLAHESKDVSPTRWQAVNSVRSNASETLEKLQDRQFRRTTLAVLLVRAERRTRELLMKRVDDEFKGLEEPINEWLEILGPEGTPSISLKPVRTGFRPSLDLRVADYPEGAVAPHVSGHFSDAQIDMLGMATHLARIEREHPGATVVIDDPSDMLDSAARKALAHQGISRLLEAEDTPAHQVVILTHDDQLVRDLWEGHRNRRPVTVQDTIERFFSEDGRDQFSVLTSRSAAEAVSRADEIATSYWEGHRDRLWFRAALAAHTRQAAEMCAKDISTLLGPAGLNYHPEGRLARESADLGNVSSQIRATLRETEEGWCNAGRHHPARAQIGEILDLFSKDTSAILNPGAHADVVLPEAEDSRGTLRRLQKVVRLLDVPEGRPRSRWTTESKLAEYLRSGANCSDCPSSLTDGM